MKLVTTEGWIASTCGRGFSLSRRNRSQSLHTPCFPRPTFLFTLPRLSFTLVHNPSSIVRSTLEIRPRHELAHSPNPIFRTC